MHDDKTRTTAIVIAVRHSVDRYATWDDVIAHAMKCKERGESLTIRRRKKTKKMRKDRRAQLAQLIASQKADQNDRRVRFENAIG
jgi:predicted transcriptional regulator